MEKVLIFFLIQENMKEVGLIINWKEKEFFLGLMEGNMMENILMIKKKDMELLNGLMEKYIKDIGKMENKMGKVNFISLPIENGKKEFGKKGKELNGYKIQMITFKNIF